MTDNSGDHHVIVKLIKWPNTIAPRHTNEVQKWLKWLIISIGIRKKFECKIDERIVEDELGMHYGWPSTKSMEVIGFLHARNLADILLVDGCYQAVVIFRYIFIEMKKTNTHT